MKFTPNGIVDLLDLHPTHNLGESTGVDLILEDLLDQSALTELTQLRLGYGSSAGEQHLRELLAANLSTSSDSVLVTQGGAAAFTLIAVSMLEPGDEVVVTSPNFPPTLEILDAFGVERKTVDLTFAERYQLDEHRIVEQISSATKFVHITSPANPSGVEVAPTAIATIAAALAEEAPDAVLVVDESYRQARHADRPETPSALPIAPNVVVTGSLSKCHGAPGLRTGWVAANSEQRLAEFTTTRLNLMISNSVVDEFLAMRVLERQDEILEVRSHVLERGRKLTNEWVDAHSDLVEWVEPHAGALCAIRTRADIAPQRFADALQAADAMLGSGIWFSAEPNVHRLGFGYLPIDVLPQALEAVGTAIRLSS